MFVRRRNGRVAFGASGIALSIVLLLATGVAQLEAQTSYGSIVGTVTDPSQSAIPGTTVTLTNIGTSERKTATSDGSGNFQFVNLIPGDYRLDVEGRDSSTTPAVPSASRWSRRCVSTP